MLNLFQHLVQFFVFSLSIRQILAYLSLFFAEKTRNEILKNGRNVLNL